MPYPKYIALVLLFLVIGLSARAQVTPLPPNLVVAWVADNTLFVRVGADSPVQLKTGQSISRLSLSPDGRQVVALNGDGGLSIFDVSGGAVRDLVDPGDLLAGEESPPLVLGWEWAGPSTLYFNTARRSAYGQDYRDDLWQLDIPTSELAHLLPPGEAGAFSLSPDAQWIAITAPGDYDHADAAVRLMNIATGQMRDLLAFPAVSTGSEYRFYPAVFWEADSRALRVALPDKDLIYDEANSPPVMLWRLSVEGSRQQIGSIAASFFGLPYWSGDAAYIAYLRRVGGLASNQFELVVAEGNGAGAVVYVSGEAGAFGAPAWIPGSSDFFFAQGQPGDYMLGSPGSPPRPLPDRMFYPLAVGAGIVYASAPADPLELRYLRVDTLDSFLIARVDNPIRAFDAIIVPES